MKIGLIGTVMHDEIETVDGRKFESFGGILYNLMALAAVKEPGTSLLPLGFLSQEHLEHIGGRYLDAISGLDRSGLRVNPRGTDHNRLKYITTSSRDEKMTVVAPAVEPEALVKLRGFDAVLVNFINARELTFESFSSLKQTLGGGLVYLDVHNLGKQWNDGVPIRGVRFHDWPRWLTNVDIVQGNEWEAERLCGILPRSEEDYRAAALKFLSVPGPRIATLTLGGQGCAIAWRAKSDGQVRYARIPAMPHLEIVDTTGCGDCFSAGFLVEYLRTGEPLKSAVFAATVSGLNCREKGLDGLARIRGVREVMHAEYGDLLQKIEAGWDGEAVAL